MRLAEAQAKNRAAAQVGMVGTAQRGKIQEESLYYEHIKRDGSLPLIGVNTFLPKDHGGEVTPTIELIRSTEPEKAQQITNVRAYQAACNDLALAWNPLPTGEGRERGG